ncbi:MAG: beta-galactosidase, partial [Armatimonadetes bacterium]|nr:beta-galactosidase [Armatimonadota bacterium]
PLYALDNRRVMSRLNEGWYDVVVIAIKSDAAMCAGMFEKAGGGVVLVDCPRFHPEPPEGVDLTAAPEDHYLMRSAGALPVMAGEGRTALAGIASAEEPPGRLVRVSWNRTSFCLTPNHTYSEHLRWGAGYQEGYLQTLIRAILWVGRREPARPASMTPTGSGAVLHASGARAHVWVTDRLNRRWGERDVDDLSGPVEIPLPPGAASGPAMFSAVITDDDGRVLDFASCLVDVPREASIVRVRSAKEWFAEGEPVSVVVETAGAVAGMTVEAVLTDIYGRETARATVPAQAGETPVELTMRDHMSTVNWVTARLLAEDEERDAARWYVLAPMERKPYLDDFRMGTWTCTTYHPGYLHDAFVATMRRAGIDEGLDGRLAYLPDLAGGVWPVSTAYGRTPGFSRFEGPGSERKPCLSDPEIRARTAEIAEQVAAEELAFRPIFGYIRDETSLVRDHLALDTCSTVHCQERYRRWLQERYASIADLNAEWGTHYGDWADAGFVTFAQARKQGNLAPWLMYRRFMDWVWADAVKWVSANARKADPGAMCALANSFGQAPFSGRDYELLAGADDYTMEYPYEAWGTTPWNFHFEAVRCFAPDVVHHPWIGYRHQPEAALYEPWWCALHGASGVSVYGAMSVFAGKNSWAQIFPTLQLTRRGRMFADVCRPLQHGIGKALMNATRPQPEIAILWSQPSLYAAWGLSDADNLTDARNGRNSYRQYFYSRDAFRRAIISTGRQFDYVSEGRILAGGLSGYRCLVLPGSFAIGPELCAALRDFVEGGGRLIADQGVGLLNGVGAPYDGSGPVAELFGIERRDRMPAWDDVQVECAAPFGGTLSLTARGHERLAPVEGAPAWDDGSPVLVTRALGRGRTVLLNFTAEKPAGLRPLFAGLSRLAVITAEDRDPLAYEVVRLDRGELHYYGILNDYRLGEDGPITVRLPAEAGRHLYDVRAHTHLGVRESLELELAPGETALLAAAPYRVDGISLVGAGRVAPGETCSLRLKVLPEGEVGEHVLRLTVADPSGEVARHYCANLLTVAGQADVEIPFAPNDAIGTWSIVARDLISGACMETPVEVGGRN